MWNRTGKSTEINRDWTKCAMGIAAPWGRLCKTIASDWSVSSLSEWMAAFVAESMPPMSSNGPASMRLWNIENGECLLERTTGLGHSAFAFHPQNGQMALGTLRGIELLDAADGRLLQTLPEQQDSAFLMCDPRGRRLASTDMARAAVHLWDLSTNQLRQVPTRAAACGVTFSPDGAMMYVGLASGLIEPISLSLSDESPTDLPADANTPRSQPVLEGHRGQVVGVAVDASGRWLVSSSWDGTVRFWDLHSGDTVLRGLGYVAGHPRSTIRFRPNLLGLFLRGRQHATHKW